MHCEEVWFVCGKEKKLAMGAGVWVEDKVSVGMMKSVSSELYYAISD